MHVATAQAPTAGLLSNHETFFICNTKVEIPGTVICCTSLSIWYASIENGKGFQRAEIDSMIVEGRGRHGAAGQGRAVPRVDVRAPVDNLFSDAC